MNLETVSKEIHDTYKWFAKEAPGVQVQETGQLAQLWALFDYFIREQAIDMTDEQIVYNFGHTTLREARALITILAAPFAAITSLVI